MNIPRWITATSFTGAEEPLPGTGIVWIAPDDRNPENTVADTWIAVWDCPRTETTPLAGTIRRGDRESILEWARSAPAAECRILHENPDVKEYVALPELG